MSAFMGVSQGPAQGQEVTSQGAEREAIDISEQFTVANRTVLLIQHFPRERGDIH